MTRVMVVAGALCGFCLRGALAVEADVNSLRSVFEAENRKIDAAFEEARDQVAAGYVKDLKRVVQYMQKIGDEFGVRPAEAELARFQRERTIPEAPAVGTPELILKARARYREGLAPLMTTRSRKKSALVEKYVAHLTNLKAGAGDPSAVDREIQRVSAMSREAGGEAGNSASAGLMLPQTYARGLKLAYRLGRSSGSRARDLSGHGGDGRLIGGRQVKDGTPGYTFEQFGDMLEVGEVKMGGYWTVLVDALFPLGNKGKRRVLLSNAFRRDHALVDQAGVLGVGEESFLGCGYNTSGLKGWHRIAVVGRWNETEFYVDGKSVGCAKALCREPLKTVGNGAGSGMPWSGAIGSVFVWSRPLTTGEIAAFPKL